MGGARARAWRCGVPISLLYLNELTAAGAVVAVVVLQMRCLLRCVAFVTDSPRSFRPFPHQCARARVALLNTVTDRDCSSSSGNINNSNSSTLHPFSSAKLIAHEHNEHESSCWPLPSFLPCILCCTALAATRL